MFHHTMEEALLEVHASPTPITIFISFTPGYYTTPEWKRFQSDPNNFPVLTGGPGVKTAWLPAMMRKDVQWEALYFRWLERRLEGWAEVDAFRAALPSLRVINTRWMAWIQWEKLSDNDRARLITIPFLTNFLVEI